jgi:hypothetical protein
MSVAAQKIHFALKPLSSANRSNPAGKISLERKCVSFSRETFEMIHAGSPKQNTAERL